MTIIFGAGGTAGHVFIARGIAARSSDDTVLITDKRGAKYCCDNSGCINKGGKEDCDFDEVIVLPFSRIKASELFQIIRSFWITFRVIRKYKNLRFIGCGAYTSLLVGIICSIKRIPITIYQGDQVPGRANRILQYLCEASLVSSDKIKLKNAQVVGCISRKSINALPMINDGRFRILIVGSSVGSSLLSGVFPKVLGKLDLEVLYKIDIVHQARNEDADKLHNEYNKLGIKHTIGPFIDVVTELPKAHLVIARAGWSLISDIISSKRAAIMIPWTAAKDNHQYYNALWMTNNSRWIWNDNPDISEFGRFIQEIIMNMFNTNCGPYVESGILVDQIKQYPVPDYAWI